MALRRDLLASDRICYLDFDGLALPLVEWLAHHRSCRPETTAGQDGPAVRVVSGAAGSVGSQSDALAQVDFLRLDPNQNVQLRTTLLDSNCLGAGVCVWPREAGGHIQYATRRRGVFHITSPILQGTAGLVERAQAMRGAPGYGTIQIGHPRCALYSSQRSTYEGGTPIPFVRTGDSDWEGSL